VAFSPVPVSTRFGHHGIAKTVVTANVGFSGAALRGGGDTCVTGEESVSASKAQTSIAAQGHGLFLITPDNVQTATLDE